MTTKTRSIEKDKTTAVVLLYECGIKYPSNEQIEKATTIMKRALLDAIEEGELNEF